MFTRSPLLLLKCYACDKELDELEIRWYSEFDGMCEECYSESIQAINDDYLDQLDRDDYA